MTDYISRDLAAEFLYRSIDADAEGVCNRCVHDPHNCQYNREWTLMDFCERIESTLANIPAADVREVKRVEKLKSLANKLLAKYQEEATACIWEYSGRIQESLDYLEEECKKLQAEINEEEYE